MFTIKAPERRHLNDVFERLSKYSQMTSTTKNKPIRNIKKTSVDAGKVSGF